MGFFSWKTQDTNRSISNVHSLRGSFPVTMTDNKGNRWHENYYDGYGEFGGKDFYDLLAEMNGKTGRLNGINLFFGVSGVRLKAKPELQFIGQGVDFFNWQEEKIYDGKSANQLLETGKWEHFKQIDADIQFPNLTEDQNWEWRNSKPEDCEYQGYFY